jgi:hypothetical protein
MLSQISPVTQAFKIDLYIIRFGVKSCLFPTGFLVHLNTMCATGHCFEIWEPQPPGTLRACPSLYRGCFTFSSI